MASPALSASSHLLHCDLGLLISAPLFPPQTFADAEAALRWPSTLFLSDVFSGITHFIAWLVITLLANLHIVFLCHFLHLTLAFFLLVPETVPLPATRGCVSSFQRSARGH